MSKRVFLALAGFSGTGKSTLAEYAVEKYDFQAFEGSKFIKEFAASAGIELMTRDTYEQYSRKLQKEGSMSWPSDIIIASDAERALQVGQRFPADQKQLWSVGGATIGLVAPRNVCLSRIDKTDPKNPQTLAEYALAIKTETSTEEYGSNTGLVVARANFIIDTSGTLKETYASFDSIVAPMLSARA